VLLVLRTGDAIPEVAAHRGEFLHWIQRGVGDAWDGAWTEHDARTNAHFPAFDAVERLGILVTGSSSSVTERAPWMLHTEAYLREAVARNIPVFGICFGHQLLAQALGGNVAKNPRGREIGTVKLELHASAKDDLLFQGLPEGFVVNATHVDTVERLPPGATVLSHTALEPHAAYRIAGKPAWGVQFHPEIDAEVMRGYIHARRAILAGENIPWDEVRAAVTDAPQATLLMRNFVTRVVRAPR
jgi:GMP synthase (glutamine-hydrolysing)